MTIDLVLTDRLVDLIAEGIDVAVRVAEKLSQPAYGRQKLGTECTVVCGAPDYFASKGVPKVPHDLRPHACLRLATATDEWSFRLNGDRVVIPVSGPLSCNNIFALRNAIALGLGLGMLPRSIIPEDLERGVLRTVLERLRHAGKGGMGIAARSCAMFLRKRGCSSTTSPPRVGGRSRSRRKRRGSQWTCPGPHLQLFMSVPYGLAVIRMTAAVMPVTWLMSMRIRATPATSRRRHHEQRRVDPNSVEADINERIRLSMGSRAKKVFGSAAARPGSPALPSPSGRPVLGLPPRRRGRSVASASYSSAQRLCQRLRLRSTRVAVGFMVVNMSYNTAVLFPGTQAAFAMRPDLSEPEFFISPELRVGINVQYEPRR